MKAQDQTIYVGGRGRVYSLDTGSGEQHWETLLKSGFFKLGNGLVTLLEKEDALFAFSYGTLYRLDKEDGKIVWEKHLPDMKHYAGLMIAGNDGGQSAAIAIEEAAAEAARSGGM